MLEARAIIAAHGARQLFPPLSLALAPGSVAGLCGPSGCGKTTFARVLAGLHAPASGTVSLGGGALGPLQPRPVQYLHQSPLAAMNPRWRMAKVISEPGPVDLALAGRLGVDPEWGERYPHELSGGQLQRASILRALTACPRYLVADEITASLDSVAQVRIWTALRAIAAERGIGILAISHDRALLAQICGDIREMPAQAGA